MTPDRLIIMGVDKKEMRSIQQCLGTVIVTIVKKRFVYAPAADGRME